MQFFHIDLFYAYFPPLSRVEAGKSLLRNVFRIYLRRFDEAAFGNANLKREGENTLPGQRLKIPGGFFSTFPEICGIL